MNFAQSMKEFESHLMVGDIDGADRMIKADPSFAKSFGKIGGEFVTPLSIAMSWGSAKLCDSLLANGARYDLPVGEPPRGGYGATSLSTVVSVGFQKNPNHQEIIDVFAKHYAQRTLIEQPKSVLSSLKEKASGLLRKVSQGLENFLKSEGAALASVTAPAAALGAKIGLGAALGVAAGAVATPLVVAATAAGAAGFVAHMIADQRSMQSVGIRGRHQEAVSFMDRLARLHVIAERSAKIGSGAATQLGNRFVSMMNADTPTPKRKNRPSLM
jgi:hypothetical protein